MDGTLPIRPEVEEHEGETTVVSVTDDEAGSVFDALAVETAQSILVRLHEEPSTPSELADHVDTSVQNVHHHLSKLEAAGLVTDVGTEFSRRGVEMDVYAPDGPIVVTLGDEIADGAADLSPDGDAGSAVEGPATGVENSRTGGDDSPRRDWSNVAAPGERTRSTGASDDD